MKRDLLARRIQSLAQIADLPGALVSDFEQWVGGLQGWDALRLNPKVVAGQQGWHPGLTVDLFVAAARAGILELEWNLVCPSCGSVVHNLQDIGSIEQHFHCTMCSVDVEAILDDVVEVAFNAVLDLRGETLDPYASADSYHRAFFSPNCKRTQRLNDAVRDSTIGLFFLGPGERTSVEIETRDDFVYRILSAEHRIGCELTTDAGPRAPHEAQLVLQRDGIRGVPPALARGRVHLAFENDLGATAGVYVLGLDPRVMEPLFHSDQRFDPYLTAKELLCNQLYRELFGFRSAITDLQLAVRSLTVLFTDLKGSTALYDRVGDLQAYRLVHDHFTKLRHSVRAHDGAMVKTMGDAIMATFSDGLDGMRAATDMVRGIQSLGSSDLGLKVGLHEGPALVIEADGRLDYFGQTVNTAARIQGQASSDEICFSEGVLVTPGVRELLEAEGLRPTSSQHALKGIGQALTVHRVQVPRA